MASLVQEQLLYISIVYQLLANAQAHGDNPTSAPCIASFWIKILPWPEVQTNETCPCECWCSPNHLGKFEGVWSAVSCISHLFVKRDGNILAVLEFCSKLPHCHLHV